MSLDAHVQSVHRNPDGSGELTLIDRPARPGGTPGCAGQRRLVFLESPADVVRLAGTDIWAGGDGPVLLGDAKIGRRHGYTKVEFDTPALVAALAAHWGSPAGGE